MFGRSFISLVPVTRGLELENLKCNLKISSATVRCVKSYGQYCAVARGLDVVGDRWTLLIVRELLTGPRRYGDLLEGLPGIATNLLAERLRHLEEHGVAVRDRRGTYRLTKWGQGLAEPVYALARWAGPLMVEPVGDDR